MISVVLLNWARPNYLRELILPALTQSPLVDEVIVSHGRADTRFDFQHERCSIVHREDWGSINERYGLARRFLAAQFARNETVLIMDDDIVVPPDALCSLHRFFTERPNRIHGIWGRRPDFWKNFTIKDVYGDVPIVVTKCMLMPRALCERFFEQKHLVEGVVTEGRPFWNGEDIFMSLVSVKTSGNLPVAHRITLEELAGGSESVSYGMEHLLYRRKFFRHCVAQLDLWPQLMRSRLSILDPMSFVNMAAALYVRTKRLARGSRPPRTRPAPLPLGQAEASDQKPRPAA
jgi:hypothetical protein